MKDHIGYIKIESFSAYTALGLPEMAYFGTVLKSDLSPRKDGSKRSAYQSNIEKQIK